MKRCLVIVFFMPMMLGLLPFDASGQQVDKASERLERKVFRKSGFIPALFSPWSHVGKVSIDSIRADKTMQEIRYYFSPEITHIPIRTSWIEELKFSIVGGLGHKYKNYSFSLWARGRLLEDYVPNGFRDSLMQLDQKRLSVPFTGPPLVSNLSHPEWAHGLTGRHIAVWPSHGLFFDQQLDRWQWQRARLWQTVEDIFPWSFTVSYLVPMLENAGAHVLLPRERDVQTQEVVVDNDTSTGASQLLRVDGGNSWVRCDQRGFRMTDTLFAGQNPFMMGTGMSIQTELGDTASLVYIPEIPETGEYAVYIAWIKSDACMSNVRYEVNYSGGKAAYAVNQCMGAGTWIYLGTFHFTRGINPESGKVTVYGGSASGVLTADAVRFGGGMGHVARKPGTTAEARQKSLNDGIPAGEIKFSGDSVGFTYKLSGKPGWMEGSRYYLQYAGMPDSLVYNLNAGKNDYNDDYMSRGEWVNYLIGPARPQYTDKYKNGLNIPVDLALAFHTDAGVTENDSVIGTLGIYSATRNLGYFPDGRSKLASRDLSDMIQTQVVEDIRRQINPAWTRRGLWDREYSEAWRPAVPVMLLELLSHQNLADMKYGLDPRFKFTVARAIYKGILRFMAAESGSSVVVQPMPPDHLAIEVIRGLKVKVSWRAVADPIEPTAIPEGFRVFRKEADDGFDMGIFTTDTFLIVDLPSWGSLYSFRVTALNKGGESMPGETLTVGLLSGESKPVLIVSAFDRICAPSFFDNGEMAGIAWWEDEGVAPGNDNSLTGYQYDFNRNSDWLHDDSQGWGASSADMENRNGGGNTFSFPLIHGKAILDAGYSFVSVSDEVFESDNFPVARYPAIDIIFGEERGTPSFKDPNVRDFRVLTPSMMRTLERHTSAGGNVFISGAYIGTDMIQPVDSNAIRCASQVLHYTWRTHHATRVGSVEVTDQGSRFFPHQLSFSTGDHPGTYRVESPDGIEPAGNGAFRIYRYASGGVSAGIAYKGRYRTVALGFPFETLTDAKQRTELMGDILNFFKN